MARRDGSSSRPWSASTLARLAWPENPNYGSHDAPWARTVLGTAIHDFLERRYSGGAEEPIADLYHAAVAKQQEVRYGREQTADTMVALGRDILDACLDKTDQYAEGVVACEASFYLSLPFGDSDVHHYDGTVDLITQTDGVVNLIDYKTGGKFEQTLYVGQAHPQPHLYATAAHLADRWATGTRYVGYHELDWSAATMLPPLWQWPSFTFLHLTPSGVVPIPVLSPYLHSARASLALVREYTRAAIAAITHS